MENVNARMKLSVSSEDVAVKDEFFNDELMMNIDDYNDDFIEDINLDVVKTEPQYRTVGDVSGEVLNTGNSPDEVIMKQSFNADTKVELCLRKLMMIIQ